MEQVLYSSIAREGLGSDEVFTIIQTASRLNPQRDITGFLIFRDGRFLQLVEGPGHELDRLIDDLLGDPRHHSLQIIERTQVGARSFPNWRMKRVSRSTGQSALDEIREGLSSNPSGEAVMDAIDEFLETFAA